MVYKKVIFRSILMEKSTILFIWCLQHFIVLCSGRAPGWFTKILRLTKAKWNSSEKWRKCEKNNLRLLNYFNFQHFVWFWATFVVAVQHNGSLKNNEYSGLFFAASEFTNCCLGVKLRLFLCSFNVCPYKYSSFIICWKHESGVR